MREHPNCGFKPLNQYQEEAVKEALVKPFTLVQGPPGNNLANFSISLLTEKLYFAMIWITNAQGPVSRKPTETFCARKAILIYLYLKTEKCMLLKLLV